MITTPGAGGAIGNELVEILAARKQPFRLVGRYPRVVPGAAETDAAGLPEREHPRRGWRGMTIGQPTGNARRGPG